MTAEELAEEFRGLLGDAYNPKLQAEIANDTIGTGTSDIGTGTSGVIEWSYSISDTAMPFLADGHGITETWDITLDDGHDGIENTPVTVTIFETAPAVPPTIPALTAGLEVGSLVVDAAAMKSIEDK